MPAVVAIIVCAYVALAAAWLQLGVYDLANAKQAVRVRLALEAASPGLGHIAQAGAPLAPLLELLFALPPALRGTPWPAVMVSCGMAVVLLLALRSGLRTVGASRAETMCLL
ncbi:MAG TPA: hypothetical protein VF157_01620, partial [Chloroflexota bacterium]